jgi:hypothetical protein
MESTENLRGRAAIGVTGLLAGALLFCSNAIAENAAEQDNLELAYRLDVLIYELLSNPVQSALNPDNILRVPSNQTVIDVRLNLDLIWKRLELLARPRFEHRWRRWDDGLASGQDDTVDEFFVNEWLARVGLSRRAFLSFGRENLQWGTARLLSPSNPFNQDNGQNNPQVEVPGSDYARLVLVPNDRTSVSLIANTHEGRLDVPNFQRRSAVKFDYTGRERYIGVIVSVTDEDGDAELGAFGGLTLSEGALIYAEGSATEDDGELLLGASYTGNWGGTFVLELFHDGAGCVAPDVAACFVGATPEQVFSSALVRENYALLQYIHTGVRDRADFGLRWIAGLDDDSFRAIATLEVAIGDHTRIFGWVSIDRGDEIDEFGSRIDSAAQVGARFVF